MELFDRLFGRSKRIKTPEPQLRFGRYSDSYKTDAKYAAWERALEKFNEQDYISSYKEFFEYLRDDLEDNVHINAADDDAIHFEIYQGSKKIIGIATAHQLRAEAKIARADSANVGFMYRLVTANYNLHYSRFAFNSDDELVIVCDSFTADGSPFKLYQALKETAVNADKLDDLLVEEFEMLHPVDNGHIKQLPDAVRDKKYAFIQSEITAALDFMNQRHTAADHQHAGDISYLLLSLVYKLDYLAKTEGKTTDIIENIHGIYFNSEDSKQLQRKNIEIRKALHDLLSRSKEEYFAEMYETTATFGLTTPVPHERIASLIDNDLKHADWCLENGQDFLALAVPSYIVGYCLFNWAPPMPHKELMHLYYEIIENDYFTSLGYSFKYYDTETKKFDKKAISRAIKAILKRNQTAYPTLNANADELDFSSRAHFAISFLLMLRNMEV